MKKFRVLIITFLTLLFGSICFVNAVDVNEFLNGKSPYDDLSGGGGEASVDLGKELQGVVVGEDGLVKKLLESMGFKLDSDQVAVAFINNIINFFLVIIGLVALAVMIFGFYKMFVSDSDEGFKDAKKLVINTVIAIVIIGMARFITSFLFDLFYTSSQGI